MKYLTLVLILFHSAGFAQAPLTLDEALEIVLHRNLSLKKQEQVQKLANLEIAISKGQMLPSIGLNATVSYTDEVAKFDLPPALTGGRFVQIELGGHQRADFAIGIRQPIFSGARLRTQVALAQGALATENSRLSLLNQATAFQVYSLFYRAQSLKREQKIHEANGKRLMAQLSQSRELFRAAQAMAFDTLQVFNQAFKTKIQLDQNQKDQRLADLQMARLLDLHQVRPIAYMDLQRRGDIGFSLDSLVQVAMKYRQELRAIRLGQESALLKKRLAKASYYPNVNAEFSYAVAQPGLNQVANEWMDFFTAGVQLQWNLWSGNQDRHRIEQAQVEYNRMNLEERDLIRQIKYEVVQSWENLKFTIKQITLAEQLLAQEQERYLIVIEQQRQGVATTNDVIVAGAELLQAELQLQRSMVQNHLAFAELLLATGSLVR